MNILELNMVEILKNLKKNYGVIGIKAEMESEGSRLTELMRLKDVIDRADLPLTIKIGGVEAVSNIYDALSIGAKGIVAPMVETAYACKKFIDAINTFVAEDNRNDIDWAINIETKTGYDNLMDMLFTAGRKLGVTVGRVDFTGSLNKDRTFVNSPEMYQYCEQIFKMWKLSESKSIKTLGGAISHESIDFIKKLVSDGLIDRYETRKIIYQVGNDKMDEGLTEGIKFELAWLKSKRRYYHLITNEDEKRITMLEERVKIL